MDAAYVTGKAVSLIKALHNTPIGAREFSGGWCPERCDAILFCSSNSYMIETKISRADFLADFKKPHRVDGGIGNYRYYACPEGLIKPDEVPDKWGLIWVRPGNKRAMMPVGYGGWLPKPGQSGVWSHRKEYESVGSEIPECARQEWNHPETPRLKFRFERSDFERNFLFALATRYKTGKFPENLL